MEESTVLKLKKSAEQLREMDLDLDSSNENSAETGAFFGRTTLTLVYHGVSVVPSTCRLQIRLVLLEGLDQNHLCVACMFR